MENLARKRVAIFIALLAGLSLLAYFLPDKAGWKILFIMWTPGLAGLFL